MQSRTKSPFTCGQDLGAAAQGTLPNQTSTAQTCPLRAFPGNFNLQVGASSLRGCIHSNVFSGLDELTFHRCAKLLFSSLNTFGICHFLWQEAPQLDSLFLVACSWYLKGR